MQTPDNFAYVVPVYDGDFLHTDDHPFCYDGICPCHEDDAAIFQVSLYVQDGLMTPDEATLFMSGRTF